MYISYDYYRIFYYVAKYGSFTQAARMLLGNQPNLTRAIKTLESELGCTLFTRSNKGVTLTPEGDALYAHVSLAVEHIQAAEDEIAMGRGLNQGVVSIGATEITLRCFLLPILNEYRKKYPHVKLKIWNLSTPHAVSALQNGLVDLTLVTTPLEKEAEWNVRTLKSFQEVPVCGDRFREELCGKKIPLRALGDYPIISIERESATSLLYTDLFAKAGIVFRPEIEVATADQIIPMVQFNLGIGFVHEDFIGQIPTGVYPIELEEPIPERDICLVTMRKHALSFPARELERMILDRS